MDKPVEVSGGHSETEATPGATEAGSITALALQETLPWLRPESAGALLAEM